MNNRVAFVIILLILLFAGFSCSTPTGRYISYRVTPDNIDTRGYINVDVPFVKNEVKVYLDEYAVPHIESDNVYDLYFAFGYMQARDRRFQMEILRNLSAGRMREMIGQMDKSGVMKRLEIFSRMIGLYIDAKAVLESANERDMKILQAYSDGVNTATEIEPVPMEFRILNYTPKPWTPEDTGVVIAMIAFGLCKNWEMELGRMELVVHQLKTGGSIDRALEIWKQKKIWGPHLFGKAPAEDPFADIPLIPEELREYLEANFKGNEKPAAPKDQVSMNKDEWAPFRALLSGRSASNNWAIGGKWTRTGKGAFSSDPHMPHLLPPLGYLAHLKCTDCEEQNYNVIGAGFVGLPAIAFGTNGKTTWGPTSNWADVTDLFVEKTVPGKPDHYYDNGKEKPFKIRKEVFRIRQDDGSYEEETYSIRETIRGVVINDFIERIPKDFPILALKRSHDPGRPLLALNNLYQSENVTQARNSLNDFTVMIGHWSLADHHGNVAYTGPLHLPDRKHHLGTFPVPGWNDKYTWKEFIPIDKLPWVENPSFGWTASANHQIVHPGSYGYPINFEGNVPFRFKRIHDMLNKGNTGEPIVAQLGVQQLDNLDAGWLLVRDLFNRSIARFENNENKTLADAVEALKNWDGKCGPESVGTSIFQTICAYLLKETMEDEVSEKTLEFMMVYFNIDPLVYSIFSDPSNPAWDDRRTQKVESAEDVIAECFKKGVLGMAERYGKKVDKWIWNTVAPFEIQHSFGSIKALGKFLNRKVPTQGVFSTVSMHQGERDELNHFPVKHGPVLRIMIDLNDLPGSKMVVPGGQSGRPISKHYDDMLDLFLKGDGISMEMDFDKIKERSVGVLSLIPKK